MRTFGLVVAQLNPTRDQAGDEEHNPFAGYEDVTREQEAQMQAKQAKKLTAKQAQWVS